MVCTPGPQQMVTEFIVERADRVYRAEIILYYTYQHNSNLLFNAR